MLCRFLLHSKVSQFHIVFSIMIYHRILNIIPWLYSRTLLFICSIYNSLHLKIPNSQSTPPLALQTVSLWSNLHAIKSKPCKCAAQGILKVNFYSCATITITILEHLRFPRKSSCAQSLLLPPTAGDHIRYFRKDLF